MVYMYFGISSLCCQIKGTCKIWCTGSLIEVAWGSVASSLQVPSSWVRNSAGHVPSHSTWSDASRNERAVLFRPSHAYSPGYWLLPLPQEHAVQSQGEVSHSRWIMQQFGWTFVGTILYTLQTLDTSSIWWWWDSHMGIHTCTCSLGPTLSVLLPVSKNTIYIYFVLIKITRRPGALWAKHIVMHEGLTCWKYLSLKIWLKAKHMSDFYGRVMGWSSQKYLSLSFGQILSHSNCSDSWLESNLRLK